MKGPVYGIGNGVKGWSRLYVEIQGLVQGEGHNDDAGAGRCACVKVQRSMESPSMVGHKWDSSGT